VLPANLTNRFHAYSLLRGYFVTSICHTSSEL
jgi:hypothetical protein